MSNRDADSSAASQPLRLPLGACLAFSTEQPHYCLDPLEQRALGNAGAKRTEQFRLGRAAAAAALAKLGAPAAPVGMLESGAPQWPNNICGAISHTAALGVCVVGWATDFIALGLDLHPLNRPITSTVAARICTHTEQRELQSAANPAWLAQAIFSAKETVFKALHPLYQQFLGFKEAELTWLPEQQRFLASVSKWGLQDLTITVDTTGDALITLLALPRRQKVPHSQ
ncbi:MAG: 4'-phosphopantetheinyl transferase superfamily protein [Oligoflexia bacterium]|nr:4'-phosphopantetheinyl transferase superfamily protein [Oligoflexia bacterium]